VAEYIKLPSLLEAGKFMVDLCSGEKHCFFRSVECVGSENRKRDKKRERWNREAEELEKLPMSELVLPLRYIAEEGQIVITEIQWILRNRSPFFLLCRLLKSIVSYMSLFWESLARGKK